MAVKRAKLTTLAATLTLAASGVWAASASAALTGTENADDLSSAVTGAPSSGASLQAALFGDTGFYPAAVSDSALGGFPTAGPSFAVLTTGDSELADDPNVDEGSGESLGFNLAARGSANDPLVLAIPINVAAPNNCLAIDYKFLSEEFPEFVNAGFNDTFLIEVDGTSWVVNPDNSLSAPGDIAAAKGDRVSVDSIGPTSVDPAQSAGTTYDAATVPLTTKTAVTAGAHTLYVSIFDSGDYIYDSAVFLDNARSFVEDPSTCRPPDIFAGATGVTVPTGGTLKVKGKSVGIPITCNLQVGITVNCDGTPDPHRRAAEEPAAGAGQEEAARQGHLLGAARRFGEGVDQAEREGPQGDRQEGQAEGDADDDEQRQRRDAVVQGEAEGQEEAEVAGA